MQINPIGPGAQAPKLRAKRAIGAEFSLTDSTEAAATLAEAPAEAACIVLPNLLDQAADDQPALLADRQARQHGGALLHALASLQAASLGGDQVGAATQLASLAASVPQADDPGLNAIIQSIAQRAAIELARFHHAA